MLLSLALAAAAVVAACHKLLERLETEEANVWQGCTAKQITPIKKAD